MSDLTSEVSQVRERHEPHEPRAITFWEIGPIQATVLHLGADALVFLNSVSLLRIPIRV
jgi:hypothetical protein